MVSFAASEYEFDLIAKIARRAVAMCEKLGVEYDQRTAMMDVTACHANGCTLQLDELLKADDFNFSHDVFGIYRHINRRTGKLENCFRPRFAV